MMNGAIAAGSGGAAAAAEMARAIKASGAIVQVEPYEFLNILSRVVEPLVVYQPSGFLSANKYLTSYKGLIFFAKSKDYLNLPGEAEIFTAKRIWIPS